VSSGTSPVQAGADHLQPAGRPQRLDRLVIQQRSLADHPLTDLLAVRHDGTAGLVQRDRAKLHGVGFGGSGALRRTATISAMIDKAISGAVTVRVEPTGPRMRIKRCPDAQLKSFQPARHGSARSKSADVTPVTARDPAGSSSRIASG
jgi:hypothetical protein